ncbi:hypothetical protein EUGRSUZ_C02011 [Eucalyptus grandis]|uniref:Uncharacterized protein n=2 Tax=Eucalyptus grandis TaxID=71139 RepID=A0ACC3LE82_EUCGR|nr:hypothetical protein EUGRSUZ_C02011 [Eucalyptus grandis]
MKCVEKKVQKSNKHHTCIEIMPLPSAGTNMLRFHFKEEKPPGKINKICPQKIFLVTKFSEISSLTIAQPSQDL